MAWAASQREENHSRTLPGLLFGVWGFWFGFFLFGKKIKAEFWHIFGVLKDLYQRVPGS